VGLGRLSREDCVRPGSNHQGTHRSDHTEHGKSFADSPSVPLPVEPLQEAGRDGGLPCHGLPPRCFHLTEAPQQYYCGGMKVPALVDIGGPWPVLPPGIHDTTLADVEKVFASTEWRAKLFDGLKRGIDALKHAGCKTVYLDGSFTTEKPKPQDYDACWEMAGVIDTKLDPVLLDFSNKRERQKRKFLGEFFPSGAVADGRQTFVEFFQNDRHTGKSKGLLRIQLV